MATTMMMCEQSVMDQESAYLQLWEKPRLLQLMADQLILAGADNNSLVVYQAQNQDLAGTSWEATGYNNASKQLSASWVVPH